VAAALSLAPVLKNTKEVVLVWLRLTDASGREVSRNAYWLRADRDFTSLHGMTPAAVDVQVSSPETAGALKTVTVTLSNASAMPAFFTRLQLMQGGEEVVPSLWSANYLTLAPGETVQLKVSVPVVHLRNVLPEVWVSGWNVPAATAPIRQ
jgi:hypothetical protein